MSGQDDRNEAKGGWKSGADRPEMAGKMQYHIRCGEGDVARYVLLPGDPGRVPKIAAAWDEGSEVARAREYLTYTGKAGATEISACSTGIGGPSTAIAVEEFAEVGADTFIRVGTTGALTGGVEPGSLVIASGAVRWDGTSPEYVDMAYPAVAHYEVTLALIEAAERERAPYHVGICASTASFHAGQSRPGFGGYEALPGADRLRAMQSAGVLSFEMESATLFTLAGLFGLRAGALFAVVANRVQNTLQYEGIDRCIRTAVTAVRILDEWDAAARAKGSRHWHPGL